MKYKLGLIALLMTFLAFGVASTAFAAAGDLVVTATADPANNVTPGDSVHVVQAFTITADAGVGNTISAISLDGSVGAGTDLVAAEITRVAIYEDVNGSGTFDFNDTLVMQKTAGADITTFVGGALSFDITDVVMAASAVKRYLAVISVAEVLDDSHSIDVAVALTATAANAGANAFAAGGTDDGVEITATHFEWIAGGYVAAPAAAGNTILGAANLLKAVDDFGNLDAGYAGEVQFKTVAYADGSDLAGLTATTGAGSILTGAANFASFVAGYLPVASLTGLSSTVTGPVTLVAVADPANAGSDDFALEGSVTIANGGYTAATGVQNTRGIEVYDVDHDGHIDHVSIFFNGAVNPGATGVNAFTVAGYTVTAVNGNNFSAGGAGVRNGGEYSVTLTVTEKAAFDTNVKPDVTYTASAGAIVDRAAATALPSIVSASAVEVDKARPILLGIVTRDADANGLLDGIEMTFSEPVTNATANTAQFAAAANIGDFAVALQNTLLGGGVTSITLAGTVAGNATNVVTVAVNETAQNTGLLPVMLFKEGSSFSIRDSATGATGGAAANMLHTDFTTFVANTGAPVAVDDGASPVITNVTTNDGDADGKIDQLIVTFSEPMNNAVAYAHTGISGYSSVAGFGSNGAAAGTYTATLGAFSASDQVITYTITEAAAAVYDTEAKPTIHYSPTAGNLRDANGFELAQYGNGGRTLDASVLIDGAKPVLVKMETMDTLTDGTYAGASVFEAAGANGRLDKLVFTFSEQVKSADYAATVNDANFDAALAQFTINHEDMTGAGLNGVWGKVTAAASTASIGAANTEANKVTPTWTNSNNSGDTQTVITQFMREVDFAALTTAGLSGIKGDTGVIPTVTYALGAAGAQIKDMNDVVMAAVATTAAKTVDKAAPFISDGIGLGYGASAFANVITMDDSSAIAVSDSFNGDGYIDAFKLQFTESVRWLSANAGADSISPAFTVTNAANYSTIVLNKGVDANLDGAITAADNNFSTEEVVIYGTSSKVADKWDTGLKPTLSFTGSAIVYDLSNVGAGAQYEAGIDNAMAAFTSKPSYDGAKPVIVRATGSVASTSILVQFSEDVYTVGAATLAGIAGNTLIKYDDYNSWGAKNVTAAVATAPSASSISVTVDSTLVLSDVTGDLIHGINAVIYDDADAVETALSDNVLDGSAAAKPAGLMITINDVIAPWISAAVTVDADGDGLIDNIRFTFSESIKDANILGYSAINTLSADVASTWVISGYTGTAKWNFFENTVDGRAAALAAGQPVFTDNAANDNVLYLSLEEAGVTVSPSGVGSTNFAPTITWGTGETMSDFKPNVINTASTETTAVNGTVTDNVGPVMMSAKTTTTTTLDVTFSEDITLGSVAKGDFVWTLGNTGQTPEGGLGWQNYIVNITKPSAGVARLEVIGDKAWTASTTGTLVQVAPVTDVKATPLAGAISGADAYAASNHYKMAGTPAVVTLTVAAPDAGFVAANKAITVGIEGSTPGADPGVTAAALKPVNAALPAINNKNLTAVKFYGTGVAGDTVTVKLTDVDGDVVTADAVVNATGNFEGAIDASPLHNGMVAISAGKSVAGAVAAWFSGGQFLKDTIVIGAPADLVVTDIADDQGGFANVSFTKSDLETAGHDFYEVDYYVLQGKVGETWSFVTKFPVDGNVDATFNATNVYVGSASEFRVNAVAKAGIAKPADAPTAMSSAYAYGTGSAIDNLLPGAFVAFAADGTAGTGVALTWTAPADHGLFNAQFGIYGVDSYEVYRRVKGTEEYVLAGTVAPGASQFTDAVALGSTVYEYMVKAVDGSQLVESQIVKAMATEGANFDGQPGVSLGDLVLFGSNWGMKSDNVNFVVNFDLDRNGEIGLGDLVLLGNAWTGAAKVAKLAEMPTANVALNMSAEFNAENSINYITISTEATGINGVGFSLKYDAEKYEFVSDSVTGLGNIPIINANDGILNVASFYGTEQFNGTITLGFKSKAQNAEMSVEMLNAEVAINGEIGFANKAGAVTVKAVPSVYSLTQNFPNPFNPTTTIEYSIPQAGNVSLVIYNIAGQKVRTLVNDVQAPAFYKVVWDGRNDNGSSVATGMYFYKLVSGNYSKIVKMTLMK